MAVHLTVAGDVFGDVLVYAVPFVYEMSWMRSGTELSQCLIIFLPTSAAAEARNFHFYYTYSYKS